MRSVHVARAGGRARAAHRRALRAPERGAPLVACSSRRGELITAVELPARARRLGLRARRRARRVVVRARRHRRRALRRRRVRLAAIGITNEPRAARPRRSARRPAGPRADRLEARARRRAVRARARPRRVAIIARVAAYDVAVIGAGTTGSSIAYFLTQRGLRPVVFEKTRAAGGPSGASAGMCRQHYASRRSSTWPSGAVSSWPT